MANRPSLDEYVDVAERIQDFMDAHPGGSLQTIDWEVRTVEGIDPKSSKSVARTFIVYRAAAYRTADDERPGTGIAWEPFPGGTPYTKDSELMNAETAAWGRAIVALGLVANRRLASRQEVRNRMEDQAAEDPAPKTAEEVTADIKSSMVEQDTLDQLRDMSAKLWPDLKQRGEKLKWTLIELGVENVEDLRAAMAALTLEQAINLFERLDAQLNGGDDSVPGSGEVSQ